MGIFDDQTSDLFIRYHARLRFRDRIAGGTPSSPKLIEGWLRSKMGLTQEAEIRELTIQTLRELGLEDELFDADDPEAVRFETLAQASEAIAKKSNTTMFKRDIDGLYIEQRAVKAMLKETVNVLYAGDRWRRPDLARVNAKTGRTEAPAGKGPRNATAEWVFVKPDHIPLGVMEPSGIDLAIGHVNGPQGPRSTLEYYEYVEQATVEFDVEVLKDRVDGKLWPEIWRYSQESGLGAKRSQGMGTFDILAWDRVNGVH